MIRTVRKKVLTYMGRSWWYRVGDTALPTRISDEAYYEDRNIEVLIHQTERGVLVGHQVYLKRIPPVPMVCGDFFVVLPYTTEFYAEMQIVFANHFIRLDSVGTRDRNYLIAIRNGTVEVPDCTEAKPVEELLVKE